jgi:hypothetical protein
MLLIISGLRYLPESMGICHCKMVAGYWLLVTCYDYHLTNKQLATSNSL